MLYASILGLPGGMTEPYTYGGHQPQAVGNTCIGPGDPPATKTQGAAVERRRLSDDCHYWVTGLAVVAWHGNVMHMSCQTSARVSVSVPIITHTLITQVNAGCCQDAVKLYMLPSRIQVRGSFASSTRHGGWENCTRSRTVP